MIHSASRGYSAATIDPPAPRYLPGRICAVRRATTFVHLAVAAIVCIRARPSSGSGGAGRIVSPALTRILIASRNQQHGN